MKGQREYQVLGSTRLTSTPKLLEEFDSWKEAAEFGERWHRNRNKRKKFSDDDVFVLSKDDQLHVFVPDVPDQVWLEVKR